LTVILRLVGYRQSQLLAEGRRAAFFTRLSLQPGERLRIWLEEHARWVNAVVVDRRRPSTRVLEELLPHTGFESVDEWIRWEEDRAGGSLPGWIIVVEPEG